jgi:MFS family permease
MPTDADEALISDPASAARTPLRRLLSGLPPAFWWLWLGTLINRAGTFIEPFFVLYLTGPRHQPVTTAGTVLLIWGFGSLFSQPVGGVLTDRFGRRVTLGLSLVATAAILAGLGVARPLWLISVLVFALGLAGDMYRPAASAAVADLVTGEDRTRAFALQFWAVNMGFSIAAVAAGVLLHLGFGLLFVLDAATTLAFGLLALRFVPETRPAPDPDRADAPARLLDPLRLLRTDRLLLVATLLVLCYSTLYAQVYIVLPVAIVHAGLSSGVYGYVIAINGVLIVIGQPLTMRAVSRVRRASLPIGMAVVGAGVAATGLCHAAWQFALTVVLWTIGEIFTAGAFQALVTSLAPDHMRGRYSGAVGLAWGASALIAAPLGTNGYAWSPTVLWSACLAVGLIAAAGQFWLVGAVARSREPGRSGRRDRAVDQPE